MAINIKPRPEPKPEPTPPKPKARVLLIESPFGLIPFSFTAGPPATLAEAILRRRIAEGGEL